MDYAALPDDFIQLRELQQVHEARGPGQKLALIRRCAPHLREKIGSSGQVAYVRTFDMATFPYPTRYGLGGAATSPAPYLMMRNRMQLVETKTSSRTIRVLINPSDAERSMAAPFFAQQIERYGKFVTRRVLSSMHGTVESHLKEMGVAPASIDYVVFDHLHVQDLRGLLGSSDGTPALLPNAKLLTQREELETLACPHPLQWPWYVADALRGVDSHKIIALRSDYLIGAGFALIRTPGHTAGNHSPVLHTDRGLWTISENGIAVDAYAPAHSDIPGIRKHARDARVEVILNANSREASLEQYNSMVLEKLIADPCRDRPEFPQHFSSSELVKSRLAPGTAPTYSHTAISHGTHLAERST